MALWKKSLNIMACHPASLKTESKVYILYLRKNKRPHPMQTYQSKTLKFSCLHWCIAWLFSSALLLLAAPATLQADDMRDIARKGEFEICVSPRAMPLSDLIEQQAGRPPGLQIEIGKELAKRLNVSLKTSWLSYRYQAKHTNVMPRLSPASLKNQPDNPYLQKTIPAERLPPPAMEDAASLEDLVRGPAVDNHQVHDEKGMSRHLSAIPAMRKRRTPLPIIKPDVANNPVSGWYQQHRRLPPP